MKILLLFIHAFSSWHHVRAPSVAPELPKVGLLVTKLPLEVLKRMVMGTIKETKEDKANSGTKDIWLEEDGTSLPARPNPIVRVSIVQNLKIEMLSSYHHSLIFRSKMSISNFLFLAWLNPNF